MLTIAIALWSQLAGAGQLVFVQGPTASTGLVSVSVEVRKDQPLRFLASQQNSNSQLASFSTLTPLVQKKTEESRDEWLVDFSFRSLDGIHESVAQYRVDPDSPSPLVYYPGAETHRMVITLSPF